VRLLRQGEDARITAAEGTVEDVVGPADEGDGWAVSVRVGGGLLVFAEDDLQAVAPGAVGGPERSDTIVLRLVTALTDGVEAAQIAEQIDESVRALAGPAIVEIAAERHWADPFHYEFDVIVRPLRAAVDAFRELVTAGASGWISCNDDGWRCDLWWDAEDDDAPGYLVPEVRGAEVSYLPWSSPVRRPEADRPLVSV
jgi:hypothetical protein